jgi:hypothetical protein
MLEPATHIDPARAGHADDADEDRPIPLLRWPDQEAERRRLVALGEPRILLISRYAAPPGLLDDLELWMLDGADPRDVLEATAGLRRKARERRPEPIIDDDGLLWFEGRWVAIPDTQLPVVDLLVRNADRLVPNDDLRDAYRRAGGSTTASSFRAVVRRVRHRVRQVGLALHVVRHRGVILGTKPAER